MECKFKKIKKSVLIFCIFNLFLSCGYFDKDKTLTEKTIVGNFKITQQENNENTELVFSLSPQTSRGLIENSIKIVYDSVNKKIFVEEFLNPYNSNYYMIKILDEETSEPTRAYNKKQLTKEIYDKSINNCKGCIVVFSKRKH